MNKQQKQIILVVALFAAGGLVFWLRMRPSAEDREKIARIEQSKQEMAQQQQAAATGSPAAGPAAARPAGPGPALPAPPPPGGEDSLEELVASVDEVEFDYEVAMREHPRNPMRPLVGNMAPARFRAEGEDGTSPLPYYQAESIARTMAVTGIVWDKHNPMAIVDGEVVTRGYTFPSGILVEDIERSRLLLRVNDRLIPRELEELEAGAVNSISLRPGSLSQAPDEGSESTTSDAPLLAGDRPKPDTQYGGQTDAEGSQSQQ